MKTAATFPIGYHAFHNNKVINFEINRFCDPANDPTMIPEIHAVASSIANYADLKREFLTLAERAHRAGSKVKAAYYFRIAEFFIFAGDPDKSIIRNRFLDLIRQAFQISDTSHFLIPYETAYLSAYRFLPDHSKGTIVYFGGFDGYQEERFPLLFFLRDAGYDVISFEGPGQGMVLQDFHLPMTYQWEKPVKAILDYFCLENVTLIGRSLGGCLSIRAAAYEPRVRRVVANDVMTDFYEAVVGQISPALRFGLKILLKMDAAALVNRLVLRQMQESLTAEWGLKHGMPVMGVQTPYEFLKATLHYQTRDVSRLVTQDVLLMASAEDHSVPRHQFYDQIRMLKNVRSLTSRLFTRYENAQNHDQIGNTTLSLSVIANWLESHSNEINDGVLVSTFDH